MKEAPGSSETSVLTRATRRNNPEDTNLHSHRREYLKSYMENICSCVSTGLKIERNEHHSCYTYRLQNTSVVTSLTPKHWILLKRPQFISWPWDFGRFKNLQINFRVYKGTSLGRMNDQINKSQTFKQISVSCISSSHLLVGLIVRCVDERWWSKK
jgi:hypothetical protein